MRSEGDNMETVQVRRWTRDEYEKMLDAGVFSPDERVELIDGEILKVMPQNSPHATAIRLTEDALRTAFGAGHDVIVNLSDLRLEVYLDPVPATEARYGWEYPTVRHYASEQEVTPLGASHARIAVQDLLP